jgi:hypothetical protein
MTNIELHIEELVLHGFNPADRHRIADALAREFEQLAITEGVLQSAFAAERVDAGQLRLSAAASPADIGAAIARNVHGAIKDGC